VNRSLYASELEFDRSGDGGVKYTWTGTEVGLLDVNEHLSGRPVADRAGAQAFPTSLATADHMLLVSAVLRGDAAFPLQIGWRGKLQAKFPLLAGTTCTRKYTNAANDRAVVLDLAPSHARGVPAQVVVTWGIEVADGVSDPRSDSVA
jgi:hypothetical protein